MKGFQKIAINDLWGGSVAQITLNSPKGNVLDMTMMDEISDALDGLRGRVNLKLIVFDAEGPHFSFGASVEEHRKQLAPYMLGKFNRLFTKLIQMSVPTLSIVQGRCLGGGLELAAFCHFIFLRTDAVLALPEINLGVFPPPASIILPEKIGQARADWMILTGESLDAATAMQWGLAQKMADADGLRNAFCEFVEKHILPKSASSLRFAIRASRWGFHRRFEDYGHELESLYINELMSSKDANEGIESFLEKRKPFWVNA